jgi:hypothetical protein
MSSQKARLAWTPPQSKGDEDGFGGWLNDEDMLNRIQAIRCRAFITTNIERLTIGIPR